MRAVRSTPFGFALLLVGLLGPGCGGGSQTTSPADCKSDPATCKCTADTDCAAPLLRCNPATSKCVPCLPTADNCGADKHCLADGASFKCAPRTACAANTDCPTADGKIGLCCGGTCADPKNDNVNCGMCGNQCPPYTNAQSGCTAGACGITSCNTGFGDCDKKADNGCEIDLTTDVKHCGDCATPCKPAPNTAVACLGSKCQYTCNQDFADCDGNVANGCEVFTPTDIANCGACGKACPALPHTDQVGCVLGGCVVGRCTAGFYDCNKLPADGCEADTQVDPNNCGGCGKKCAPVANGQPGCQGGVSCGIGSCNAGFGDCDGDVLNGCEKDLSSDKANCGKCGAVCAAPNATTACNASVCSLVSCTAGFADCDKMLANGCETPVLNDLKNCGACGNVCPAYANATGMCSQGKCSIASCMYGWADCDKDPANGCEVDITQVANCGACGNKCTVANGTPFCRALTCAVMMCNAGFADCDGNYNNGCETPTSMDIANCGACGKACSYANAKAACAGGMCQLSACTMGYGDCNKNAADGCEANLGTDAKNCGACGNACGGGGQVCNAGVCGCPMGQTLCNGTCANLQTDAKNCGACGNACGGGTPYCAAGKCTANPCVGKAGNRILAAQGTPYLNFCWYLSVGGATCDQVCSDAGGTNMANDAIKVLSDDCPGGAAGQPSTWFYENGNPAGWLGNYVTPTGYRTLGHGYTNGSILGRVQKFVGRCDQGGIANSGTFPGEVNDTALQDNNSRLVICACDH